MGTFCCSDIRRGRKFRASLPPKATTILVVFKLSSHEELLYALKCQWMISKTHQYLPIYLVHVHYGRHSSATVEF
jgi:hypothetical protein